MCRFVIYLGPEMSLDALITAPRHSLVHQSYESLERREPLNGDGFGIAWFVPALSARPAVFRSISPAWSNRNLEHLCRVTRSATILAHIRAASPGLPVVETNCHPFADDELAFMHNGFIGGFLKLKRRLVSALSEDSYNRLLGSTDSEHAFAMFRDRYAHRGSSIEDMAAALAETIRDIEALKDAAAIDAPSLLNLVVSDGRKAVVSRYASDKGQSAPSLYVHEGKRYVCEGDVCRMVDADEAEGAVIVASEKLSDDPGWDRVEANHLVLIDEDRKVSVLGL